MSTSPLIPTPELISRITTSIQTSTTLHPTPAYINSLLPTLKPSPLPALTKTASFRLLTTDFTTTLSHPQTPLFPPTIHDAALPEYRLPGEHPMPVQVVSVEDLGRSRMEQLEKLEAGERGEAVKGVELVRTGEEDEDGCREESTKGPCKLVLEDAKGVRVFGIELKPVEGVKLGMFIGTKLLLHNTIVARAVLLLEPATTTILGGKIEALHAAWLENRKKELLAALEAGKT
ncbi:hypothetical protein FGG08_002388 [Glutinoglossum americanum]|uniref:RecQ-mediated genome instability protein 1 n=1 Tax=Glutinoglossum americanum TaxID=1670608 RepID=A0A9P8I6G2_9PEZI|nr:hypothetical protein FGG08_002388 [Glutinoglossum americanum]